MIIKKELRKKKNKFISFTKFLYFYFIISTAVILLFLIAIYQSHFFSKEKDKFLDYISKAGRYEYLSTVIAYKAVKSNFYKLDSIDLEIPFENTIILKI